MVSTSYQTMPASQQPRTTSGNVVSRDGLAEFRDNPDHRTSPLLALTPAGRRALEAITRRADAAHRAMGEGIAEADLAAARTLLRRLTAQTDRWAGADALAGADARAGAEPRAVAGRRPSEEA
ncbi:hypothetical protein [Streptomyces sp. NPDC091371]|uniref:hypothetical protein n=1 Tax=Streptomyces sp. NPDC091371 TaxID=3155303 RepID=UPI00342910AF